MINARIIDAVPLDEQIELSKCQAEIAVEESCKLIVQFDDLKCWLEDDLTESDKGLLTKCKSCQELDKLEKYFKCDQDYAIFMNKYNKIKSSSSQDQWLAASKADLINAVSSLVSCVGCRTSLERFYRGQANKLVNKSFNFSSVIYPFLINSNECVSLCSNVLDNPFKLFSIFNLKNSRIEIRGINRSNCSNSFRTLVNSEKSVLLYEDQNSSSYIQKLNCLNSKICNIVQTNSSWNKNRRCQLHSLERTRFRSMNDWLMVWDAFAKNSTRSKILLIDTSKLLETVDSHLKRHRFCPECKVKVIKAFKILTGKIDASDEKNYCASIYDGIESCSITSSVKKTKLHLITPHLHLKNDKNFIARLIYKAETEIQGGRRERHAKTLDTAQEEVLTCIGIHLFEKFFLLFQSIRLDEQIWQLMVYSSITALKKNFELRYEQLQGVSNLELVCAQLQSEETKKKLKQKKRKRKNKTKSDTKDLKLVDTDDHFYESENSQASSPLSKSDNNEKLCDKLCHCLSENKLSLFNSMSSSSSSTSSSSTDDLKDFSFASFINESDSMENNDDSLMLITDEEKNEYYANKSIYLNERTNRRLLLREKFQNLKLNASLKLRPRN